MVPEPWAISTAVLMAGLARTGSAMSTGTRMHLYMALLPSVLCHDDTFGQEGQWGKRRHCTAPAECRDVRVRRTGAGLVRGQSEQARADEAVEPPAMGVQPAPVVERDV